MNENARIYICTHTDFECPVSDPVYEIADSRDFGDDIADNGMDAMFYSELLTYHRLASRPESLPDYVGFCGYRKYFSFMDDVPDIAATVERHGCITVTPKNVRSTVYEQYARCLCFADLDIMKAVIYGRFPNMYTSFKKSLEGPLLYRANMFIMRREDFLETMDTVWGALDGYLEIVGKDIRQRITDNRCAYLDRNTGFRSVEHQFRIGGNLGERIVSAILAYRYPDAKTYDIVFTEKARPHRQLIM